MRMTTALTCAEVSTVSSVKGELGAGPSGFEAVACMKRSELVPSEATRPARSDRTTRESPSVPARVWGSNQKEDHQMTAGQSDPPIVLGDGRADHEGKGRAERLNEHSNHALCLRRLAECGLELHPQKTKIVYCKDDDRASRAEIENGNSHTPEQRFAESTARSFRGARCEYRASATPRQTARRDLRGGSSATASPTLMKK